MDKKSAMELLRYAKAFDRADYGFVEEKCAILHLAHVMARNAGFTEDEILAYSKKQISKCSAIQLVEKYDKASK